MFGTTGVGDDLEEEAEEEMEAGEAEEVEMEAEAKPSDEVRRLNFP
jgi:hypothetical protein